eukprot:TRINITY_DN731_c0_g1_i4.p1 TRINITY_DN731_c0_g1~~TRINITY_DN731_c0_g1_i4.p1  ORF type:complete len:656 (+),score=317.43 TRINITY_DN731_c0_g1_i4:1676-3643(+)
MGDPSLSQQVIASYADQYLNPKSSFGTFCLLSSGRTDEAFQHLVQGLSNNSDSPSSDWKDKLSTLVAAMLNKPLKERSVIGKLGDYLWANQSSVDAAHVCYLLSGLEQLQPFSDPNSRMVLLGADHKRRPRSSFHPSNILLSELLEAIQGLSKVPVFQIHLVAYRFYLAQLLADWGLISKSSKAIKSLKATIDSHKQLLSSASYAQYHPLIKSLTHSISEFEQRLDGSKSGSNIASSLFRSFSKFVNKIIDPPATPSPAPASVSNPSTSSSTPATFNSSSLSSSFSPVSSAPQTSAFPSPGQTNPISSTASPFFPFNQDPQSRSGGFPQPGKQQPFQPFDPSLNAIPSTPGSFPSASGREEPAQPAAEPEPAPKPSRSENVEIAKKPTTPIKKEPENTKSPEKSSGGGWFSSLKGIFGSGSGSGSQKAHTASLGGGGSEFVYNETYKRWMPKNADPEEFMKTLQNKPPPPTMSQINKESSSGSLPPSASAPSLSLQTSGSGSGSMPPSPLPSGPSTPQVVVPPSIRRAYIDPLNKSISRPSPASSGSIPPFSPLPAPGSSSGALPVPGIFTPASPSIFNPAAAAKASDDSAAPAQQFPSFNFFQPPPITTSYAEEEEEASTEASEEPASSESQPTEQSFPSFESLPTLDDNFSDF